MHGVKFIVIVVCVVIIACQGNKQTLIWVKGGLFQHAVIDQQKPQKKRLHVYIEGDGRPWKSHNRVATDPTSRQLLMLHLMQLDTQSSIYVGRPCYFNPKKAPCSAIWWTHKRYAETVRQSILQVIKQYSRHYQEVILFGHSGGGTLAVLIAAQLPRVRAVVTLAANLDIHAWADFHAYSRLSGSLNPIDIIRLPASIVQYHYIGVKDKNIDWRWIKHFVDKQPNAVIKRLDKIDHNHGWEQEWPAILTSLSTRFPT